LTSHARFVVSFTLKIAGIAVKSALGGACNPSQ
jgi:hypothetical protein